ncbi:MAG: Cna B-type domain-containing protein, partial [Lachnospiraceae bacterium]|nr:Cna B-type domain-containing protein [Lachnospiraceae bacterium]
KTVAGDYTASDTDTFPITIMNGEKYLNAAGELVDSDPGLTVKAGAANKLTFADIPEGTYVVTEGSVELTGYQIVTTYSVTTEGAEAVKTQNAAVTKDQTTLAEITNTYVKDFEFTKVWKRADGAGNDEWVKNITVTLHRKAGTVLDTAFEREFTFGTETVGTTDDGITWVRTGNAADGYTFTFSNLTAADSEGVVYIYTVTENELADYNTSYAGSDQQILVNAEEATAGGCIVNTPVIAVALPETGGPGTHLYTVLGLMLIAFAGIWYAVRMRNSFKRQ